jgi:hypothetical protein
MSTQHTPGPWAVCKSQKRVSVWSIDQIHIVDLVPTNIIKNQHLDNARLIAAAPDLLDALKDAYPYIQNDALRERVGNTIAKATIYKE